MKSGTSGLLNSQALSNFVQELLYYESYGLLVLSTFNVGGTLGQVVGEEVGPLLC
jgi:hypothetical protein